MATVDATCLLKISNSDDLLKLLHSCVDDLIGRNKINFDSFNNDVELTKDELKKAQNFVQTFYKNLIVNREGEFESKTLVDFPENLTTALRNCFEIRKRDLQTHAKRENVIRTDLPMVRNFDWKIKWVIGSSSLATLSEPLAQLDLHCYGKDDMLKTVNFEMSYEQVEKMIEELEAIKK